MVLEVAVNGRADWIITFNVADYAVAERFQINIGRPEPVLRQFKGERG